MEFVIDTKKSGKVRLWLERDSDDDSIDLLAQGENDDDFTYLMTFQDGDFKRHTDVDIEGIETDADGRIREYKT